MHMKQATPLLLSLSLLLGCAIAKQAPTPTKQTFTFDYTPKESSNPGSASMVLAFLKPYYAATFMQGGGELFKSFKDGLTNDIEELIIAKGFTLKGPYQGYDEMVFDDKKRIEMAIVIEISPQFTAVEGDWKQHTSILNMGSSPYSYSYEGKMSLVGKINVSGIEPLTNEKIWSKSVTIPNVENVPIVTSVRYSSRLTDNELMSDPAVYNAMGKALQSQYSGIMDKIAAHFNKEEFKTLQGQIKELKSKKGF